MKKIYISILLLLSICMLTSCRKNTLINEVINREVEYGENVSILDFEDAISEASLIAQETVVAIKITSQSVILASKSFGSGVIIKKDQINEQLYNYYVITNKHVVLTDNGNARKISITFGGTEEYKAKICKVSSYLDIAVISFECPRILAVASICLDKTNVGRFVIAVGNPYDVDKYYRSVTIGNISYVDRIIEEEDENGRIIKNKYLQHNAEINSGNSGGGLFNIKGELIGINTWKIVNESIEGMGFAIPLDAIYKEFDEYLD